ncbi:MAG TPA: hypothetical protein VFC78_07330 [Tepidisphaeraceae bacterium]|nr:hypothetical protein [Tepidisphaeraceae bacterium]
MPAQQRAGDGGIFISPRQGWRSVGIALAIAILAASPFTTFAAPKNAAPVDKSPEAAYYKIIDIPIPQDIVLECGGFDWLPDGRLAIGTRRGDVYLAEGVLEDPPAHVKFTKWATGLHEILGVAYNKKDGYLYICQRPEITRLKDTDGRGHANVFETYFDGFGISGDYHEYAFMSHFDKQGSLYLLLTLTGSFTSEAPFRGWCLKVTPDGKGIPWCSGVRSPGGVGFDENNECFYASNQGPWQGADALRDLVKDSFQGHPIGNKWYSLAPNMGPRPEDPVSGGRRYIEAKRIKQLLPPAILQPYGKVGQSQSGIVFDTSLGKFGPFAHQCISGDQHHSNMARYVLQKVKGRYQGVCIPFREGFSSGVLPMIQAADGSIMVGETNRGWGSAGPKPFSLQRVVWTGKTPFEIYDMKLTHDGFDLTFTEPLDTAAASNVANYKLSTFRYIYQESYGSPEVDQTTPTIKSATVSQDRKKVHIAVDGLQEGAIHELHLPDLRSADGKPLLHPVAYYTLWQFVDADGK